MSRVLTSGVKTRRKNNVSEDRRPIKRRITSKTSASKRESSSLPIPLDVIIEIFARLPLRSIAICRCVSKQWAIILRRSDFTEVFLTRSSTRPKLLFAPPRGRYLILFSSPQPRDLDDNSRSSLSADRLMRFSDLKFDYYGKPTSLVNGLFNAVHTRISKRKKETVPVICNPSTGHALILPKVRTGSSVVKSLLGYDPIDKQHKVLSMAEPWNGVLWNGLECEHHQVLTLGAGKMSWRMIDCCVPHPYPHEDICIDGVLYYTCRDMRHMIVYFDIRSEKFGFVRVEGNLQRAVPWGNLIRFNGKLGVVRFEDSRGNPCFNCRSTGLKLWALENLEKHEWSEHAYVLPASWRNIVEGKFWLKFVGVTRANEIVLSLMYPVNRFYLVYFSPERNTIARVEILGMDVLNSHIRQTFLDYVEDVKLCASMS